MSHHAQGARVLKTVGNGCDGVEKKHVCANCGVAFGSNGALNNHRRAIHGMEWKNKASVKDKSGSRKRRFSSANAGEVCCQKCMMVNSVPMYRETTGTFHSECFV